MSIPSGIKKYFKTLDYPLVILTLLCCAVGILVCRSSTAYLDTSKNLITQCIAAVIGLIIMVVVSLLDYDAMLSISKYFFAIIVGLLVITLIIGSGDEVGSKSWIHIPGIPFNFQTAEFAKLVFAVTFAAHLDSVKEKINDIKNVAFLALHAGIIIGLVLLQGDLGSALVFIVMFAAMCFYAKMSIWYFAGALGVVVIASPIVWKYLPEYRKMRILVGFNPDLDPQKWGYQQIQSRRAISLGGLTGSGYMNGTLTSNGNVPKQETDFAFSVLGEDFGIVGCVLAVILFTVWVLRILHIARQARSDAGGYICMGIAAMLIFQIIENVGMCLGLLPVIGIPLPFVSYGGSSVISIFFGIGIVLAVSARKNIYYSKHNDIFALRY